MFGPPVLADCYTRPRGAVVLWSSTPCTSAYLTELWPAFKNFRRPRPNWATVIFRFRTSSVSVIARQSPYGRRDLADLTAIRPFRARYVMFGPPVLADCYTRPRGAVVLRSSTPCTLAYLTELRPTFKNFRPPLVLTLATMLFRLFLVGYIEKVVMSDNTGSNFNSTYHRYLSTRFRRGLVSWNQCTVSRANPSRNSVWAIIGEIKFFVALYEAVLRFSI
jgi:hypothetical protein